METINIWRNKMRNKISLYSLIIVLLSFSLIIACGDAKSNNDTTETATSKVDNSKNFSLTLLNGKSLTLADLKGKAVILDVWDTWCPPCKAEIPHFISLYNDYKDKGLVIVGIAGARDGKEAVEKFINDYGVNYLNTLLTPEFNQTYGPIQGIPTTFVLDKNGNIYKKYVGFKDRSIFENDIKTILGI
jgi:thiol-disulfide isomerase/thioredoxin